MASERWLDVDRLLLVYFARRYDWPIISPLGRDPSASRSRRGDFSKLVGQICDVGVAMETLTTEQQAAITYRWILWLSREEGDGKIVKTMAALRDAERAGNKGRVANLRRQLKELRDYQSRVTAELRRHERRKAYTEGMRQLEIELRARDLYARAARGEQAGI